jgi:hypothetical protein
MRSLRKDIPSIIGLLGAISLACVSTGITTPAVLAVVGGGLAENLLDKFDLNRMKKWFIDTHPNDLNHSIKKLFIFSIEYALSNILIIYKESGVSVSEIKIARKIVKNLQKDLPSLLKTSTESILNEDTIKKFLSISHTQKSEIFQSFFTRTSVSSIEKSTFWDFLSQHLSQQVQLCFGEGLKDPKNQAAWIAFQRLLIEDIKTDIQTIMLNQDEIKNGISNIKVGNNQLSDTQIDELKKLILSLNDNPTIKFKISKSLSTSLKSIEEKENEIIRTLNGIDLKFSELKQEFSKIRKSWFRKIMILYLSFIITLVGVLLVTSYLVYQPFSTTIIIYGWKGTNHFPLKGVGTIELDLGNRLECSDIDSHGAAKFVEIPSSFNNKDVKIKLTSIQGVPYFLQDSIIRLHKSKSVYIQVDVKGMEKLSGEIVDRITGENIIGAIIKIQDLVTLTDSFGMFHLEIPPNKREFEQELEVLKAGYITYRKTIPMIGYNEFRLLLQPK